MRREARTSTTLFVAVTLVIAMLTSVSPVQVAAAPTNAKIEARKKQAAQAEARMEDLAADLEERTEERAEVEAALAETTQRIVKTEGELERATRALASAEVQLKGRAVEMYRTGPESPFVLLLGIRDFNDFFARLELMSRIGQNDVSLVESVTDARERVEQRRESLESRRAEQVALREQAQIKQREVDIALADQRAYVGSLQREITRLIEKERERQRKIAEERARRLAAAQAAQAKAAANGVTPAKARSARAFDPEALGAAHPEAVTLAMQYLGVPYLWGGTTPSGFDCSGLCQYVYEKIGIGLPRNSRAQYRVGAYIPPDRRDLLQPGDLVFFGRNADASRVHHVGIYAGEGQFIHAPYTGDVVRVSSLDERIASKADYVGAVRP